MYFYNRRGQSAPVEPTEPTVGDIRSLTDVNETTSPNMGHQHIGCSVVKSSKKNVKTVEGKITTLTGHLSSCDPNNIVSKFGERFDDRKYYRRNRT